MLHHQPPKRDVSSDHGYTERGDSARALPTATINRPCPCDGCGQAPRCRAQLIACSVFIEYVGFQRADVRRKRTQVPTRARYNSLFSDNGD